MAESCRSLCIPAALFPKKVFVMGRMRLSIMSGASMPSQTGCPDRNKKYAAWQEKEKTPLR
jgi:hypothetical protein